jgi:hypothetical protein
MSRAILLRLDDAWKITAGIVPADELGVRALLGLMTASSRTESVERLTK